MLQLVLHITAAQVQKGVRKIGKPKLACQDCGLDYQSKAAVNRHVRQKHNGKARIITYNKLLADIKDGMYVEHLVGRPAKTQSSKLRVTRTMQEELTRKAVMMIPDDELKFTLKFPEIFAPLLKPVIASYIDVLTSLFDDPSAPDVNLPYPEINNDKTVHNYAPSRPNEMKHNNIIVPGEGADAPKKKAENMTQLELLRESMEARRRELLIGSVESRPNTDPRKPDT